MLTAAVLPELSGPLVALLLLRRLRHQPRNPRGLALLVDGDEDHPSGVGVAPLAGGHVLRVHLDRHIHGAVAHELHLGETGDQRPGLDPLPEIHPVESSP